MGHLRISGYLTTFILLSRIRIYLTLIRNVVKLHIKIHIIDLWISKPMKRLTRLYDSTEKLSALSLHLLTIVPNHCLNRKRENIVYHKNRSACCFVDNINLMNKRFLLGQ